jgi:hypothetical protein
MFQVALEKLFEQGCMEAVDSRRDRWKAFYVARLRVRQAAAAESLPFPAALRAVFGTGNVTAISRSRCFADEEDMLAKYVADFAGESVPVQASARLSSATVWWLLFPFIDTEPDSSANPNPAPEGVSQALIDAVAEQRVAPLTIMRLYTDTVTTEQLIAAAFDSRGTEWRTGNDSFVLELTKRPDCAPAIVLAAAYLLVVWNVFDSESAAGLAKLVADKFRGVPETLTLPPVIV